ncbi:hypothetical protein V502_06758 [Pseudogymnoascus sp. VKM F-4520 (FW-2644)]|nr:hypothetical protein V502_06758 [Pseudogymnoascus sp. VKM F-4520 (FW-2644)]
MGVPPVNEVNYRPYGPGGIKGLLNGRYVMLCACLATLGGFEFGYDQGIVSVILGMEHFLARFPQIDPTKTPRAAFYTGFATGMLQLGGSLGTLLQSWVADRCGRKKAMQPGAIVFIIGSIVQAAAMNYSMLIVGRFVGGFGVGMLALVAPVYMSEISPAEVRGGILVLEFESIVFGRTAASWITYGTRYIPNEWQFRLPFVIQIVPAVALAIIFTWMPESPRWLAYQGRNEECLQILQKLREVPNDDPRITAEFFDILAEAKFHHEVQEERHGNMKDKTLLQSIWIEIATFGDLYRHRTLKRTLTGASLVFLQQFVGINALIYYAPSIFQSIALSYDYSLLMTGVMNCMQPVGVTAAIPLMDWVGRRPLLLWGAIAIFPAHLCLAIIVGLYSNSWSTHSTQGWTGVGFILWYMVAFGASWSPIPWSMPAEIFPASLRAKGTAMTQFYQWFFNFVIGLVTPPMIQSIGWGTYAFFGIWCLIAAVWAWLVAPETKNVSFEEMDVLFGTKMEATEEARKQEIKAEIALSAGFSDSNGLYEEGDHKERGSILAKSELTTVDSALMRAASDGEPPTVELLLQLGASVNSTGGNDKTPLMCAFYSHKGQCGEILVTAGNEAEASR